MPVLNKYKHDIPTGAVNIMRPGPLGNPFIIGRDGDRNAVCDKHLAWARLRLQTEPEFKALIKDLHGKILICCCKPLRCHGDNYVLLAEELNEPPK